MWSASPDDALEPNVFSLLFFVGLVAIGAHWHFSQNDPNHQVFVKLDPPLTQLYTKVGQINVPWIQQSPRRFCSIVLGVLLLFTLSSGGESRCIEYAKDFGVKDMAWAKEKCAANGSAINSKIDGCRKVIRTTGSTSLAFSCAVAAAE